MKRILFTVFVILVLVRACSSDDTPGTETGTASQAAPQAAPVAALSVTPESLNLAFREDEQAARKRYMDKRLIVRGKISRRNFYPTQTPFLVFDPGKGDKALICKFPYSDREAVAALFNGQTVEIEGKLIANLDSQLHLFDCVFVNTSLDPDLHAVMWAAFMAEKAEYDRSSSSGGFFFENTCTQALKHEWRDKDKLAYILAARSGHWSDIGKTEPALADADKAIVTAPDKPYGYLSKARAYKDDITLYTEWMRKGLERTTDKKEKAVLEKKLATAIAESTAIEAILLSSAFKSNEVAAEEKYKGKNVRVQGLINAFSSLSSGEAEVALLGRVSCIFQKNQRAVIAKLEIGKNIVIEGICTGLNQDRVYLKHCRIIAVRQ